jgi:uracil-DNA glycosylase family 4
LREYCAEVAVTKRAAYRGERYWGKPVENFGDAAGRLLIVGLAPGAHGANRTGRMFTGDRSGDFLYDALHRTGFANQPASTDRGDGLALTDALITAAGHCAPPGNKPTPAELAACFEHLVDTARAMPRLRGMVALGGIAFEACVKLCAALGGEPARPKPRFAHGAAHELDAGGRSLFVACCYHPSQQNTFTGRLTKPMMVAVFEEARRRLG